MCTHLSMSLYYRTALGGQEGDSGMLQGPASVLFAGVLGSHVLGGEQWAWAVSEGGQR